MGKLYPVGVVERGSVCFVEAFHGTILRRAEREVNNARNTTRLLHDRDVKKEQPGC